MKLNKNIPHYSLFTFMDGKNRYYFDVDVFQTSLWFKAILIKFPLFCLVGNQTFILDFILYLDI